ncbi:MAG TPA: hypothetical protein VGL22_06150 [Terracidiphilus sp.]
MICVFTDPGDIADAPGTPTFKFVRGHADRWERSMKDAMRSTEYDTVSVRYARYLREEILADVGAKYNLRKDAYSHAITGCRQAASAALTRRGRCRSTSRGLITWIGSFTSIQWKETAENPEGGQDYPDKILREDKRKVRAWLQDGSNDLENPNWGDWPAANIRMANALKTREYDFHFSFGKGTHNPGQGAAECPTEMIWLWRDHDAGKTEQEYAPDPRRRTGHISGWGL